MRRPRPIPVVGWLWTATEALVTRWITVRMVFREEIPRDDEAFTENPHQDCRLEKVPGLMGRSREVG
jgi:hypothetical protein